MREALEDLRTTCRARRGRQGQAVSETLFLLPLYLALVFLVIQIGQLGLAMIITNYGASKVAHQAVSDNTTNPDKYKPLLDSVMVAGMKTYSLTGKVDDPNSHTRTLTVEASAKIQAFPMIGEIFHAAIGSNRGGPVQLSDSAPYFWIVTGTAQGRMNFLP